MPKYLISVKYTTEGVKGLLKEGGSARKAAVAQAFEKAGGRLEAFYFAFGKEDVFVIGELPDNATAAGISLTVAASGAVSSRTTVLLDVEEIDKATGTTFSYRAAGQ
jgi:uncharacterized protein with GYD domain